MYFTAGLKYFKNVFPCRDTASLWHSVTTLISKFGLPNKMFTTETTDFTISRA
jgi:hypothetical protein